MMLQLDSNKQTFKKIQKIQTHIQRETYHLKKIQTYINSLTRINSKRHKIKHISLLEHIHIQTNIDTKSNRLSKTPTNKPSMVHYCKVATSSTSKSNLIL